MLSIFSDLRFLPEGVKHALPLIPFWGNNLDHDGYTRFASWARDNWRLTAPEDAQIAVLPFDGREVAEPTAMASTIDLARRFVDLAASAGLRTLIVLNHDTVRPLPISGPLVVLRTSLDRHIRAPWEFALPAWHENIVDTHLNGRLPLREYQPKPVVSFCGIAARTDPPVKRRVKLAAISALKKTGHYWPPPNDGIYLRRLAMSHLKASRRLGTNFIVRDHYFGGSTQDPTVKARVRAEYVRNILDSDYVLCVRGWGNFSFRFFEAMSLGRTPVLIDTDCVLPLEFLHNYKSLCVIVPEDKLHELDQRVSEFHACFDDRSYRLHQESVRSFWVECLSAEGFFRNLPAHWKALGLEPLQAAGGG
jgi:Exostosin family